MSIDERFGNVPEPIEAWCPLRGVDEPITLYEGELQVNVRSRASSMHGRVEWAWRPSPHLAYKLKGTDDAAQRDFLFADPDEVEVTLALDEIPRPPTETAEDEEPSASIHRDYMQPLEIGSGTRPARVVFQVCNLPPALGDPLRQNGSVWKGRRVLRGGQWIITLDARRDHRLIRREVRSTGGYVVTHTAELRRLDGRALDTEEIKDALSALRHTLSFASGRWVTPLLSVGYDEPGDPVWADWTSYATDPWRGRHALADEANPQHIPILFSLLADVWQDEFRAYVVRNAINYYVKANDPDPLELAVSTSQAGLELLAWAELVEDKRVISATKYGDNRAHQNIETLLQQMRVPLRWPDNVQALQQEAEKHQKTTPSQMLAYMRNGVIHPRRTRPRFGHRAWLDAWRVAQHYLLLCILSYLNYSDTYRDPLSESKWTGHVDKVPWSSLEP